MPTLLVNTSVELNRELAEEYFAFKWKEKLSKENFLRGPLLAFFLFTTLFILTEHILFLTAIICSIGFVLYSIAAFFRVKAACLKRIKNSEHGGYEMSYSDKGISYKLPNAESNFEWPYFKCYEANGSTIYLYSKKGDSMVDLLSERKIGQAAFAEIRDLIVANVPKR